MDTLRLINLGYLSYVNFLINDMDSMREYLAKSISIMVESLSVYFYIKLFPRVHNV